MLDWCKSWFPQCPIVRKCCFCVPIRRGVTIFGYVNLVLSLLSLPVLVFLLVEHTTAGAADGAQPADGPQAAAGAEPAAHLPLTIAFVAVDVLLTVVLLVGAHRKQKALLKIYFYFGAAFQLVTLCLDLVYFEYTDYAENILYLFFLGLNVYLLFLVLHTVLALEQSAQVQYVAYREDRLRRMSA